MTLGDLAEALGAELVGGEASQAVTGVSGLEQAAPGHVVYVEDDRRQQEGEATPAVALIGPLHLQPRGKPLLRVANPRLAFARALRLFAPPRPLAAGVHPSAVIGNNVVFGERPEVSPEVAAAAAGIAVGPLSVIGDGCVIGPDVQIHPLVILGNDVRIGPGSVIYPNVTMYDGVSVGGRVVVHAGSVIGSDGFGYALDGEKHIHLPHVGTVIIEDDVEIGANVTVDRGTTGATVVGQGTKIDNLVHIAHNVKIGRHCLLAGQVGISGSVTIGDSVVLAGQAGVTDHVVIGDRVQAGARAAIIRRVPAGTVVWGCPARPHGEQLRIDASLPRVPQLLRTIRDLEMRLRRLEERLSRSS